MRACLMGIALSIVVLVSMPVANAGDKVKKGTIKADDGVNIAYEAQGKGDTALIFLHGWCGDREYWKHQADVFAGDYRVITLDQAGHGESGKDRKKWTTASLADDVQTVAKSLELKRVILIGHSMGGPISLLAAKRMPETVVGVVGVDTLQNVEAKMPEEVTKKFMEAFEKDFKGTMRMGLEGMVHDKTDADVKKWLVTRAEAQDQKRAIGLIRDMTGLDQKSIMKDAKVKIRCINSSGGFKFFTPTSVETNKKYADYNAVLMDSVGHYPMLEQPEEFNRNLRKVLVELAGK